jgi:hypothetical protein
VRAPIRLLFQWHGNYYWKLKVHQVYMKRSYHNTAGRSIDVDTCGCFPQPLLCEEDMKVSPPVYAIPLYKALRVPSASALNLFSMVLAVDFDPASLTDRRCWILCKSWGLASNDFGSGLCMTMVSLSANVSNLRGRSSVTVISPSLPSVKVAILRRRLKVGTLVEASTDAEPEV